ncbi:acetyl-CoA carboxylase, biotin carboxyl carrier protein [Arthrobacter sp. TS-15]|uniref:acetyl-CoA carboxylase biotin carboxyl carrier protein n=1 Tax=Arthrobacter sp. TS-15 TaxID=2510797 RepID=UPI00115C51EE|nr:biotin/lipoyl-containing protein [Arthrobacter sp. TS-15]TQS88278.1 acetyl-CoA carboxylase, biotin carboxyl carrier protein [Arthrobacter sp. TS-15]
MDVDLEELAAIIEQLDKTEFTDFLYEKGDLRLHVRRGGYIPDGTVPSPAAAVAAAAPAAAPTMAAAAATPAVAPAPAAPVPAVVHSAASNGHSPAISPDALPAGHILVTAPMLGTYYGAPKPGEPAFVQVGDTVSADAVLCIVEVMKLMNSVTAGAAGEVAAVFVKDGDLVEFEQPLFAIRATS